MGYTGWLMPDGKFYPCKHKEHTKLLRELLEKSQYEYLIKQNLERLLIKKIALLATNLFTNQILK